MLASLGATGVVLGAWYMLTMVRQVFFGPVKEPPTHGHGPIRDLNGRELAALLPIAGLCLALGIYPKPFFDTVRPEMQVVAGIADERGKRQLRPSPLWPRPQGESSPPRFPWSRRGTGREEIT